jgi:hypothetical protein
LGIVVLISYNPLQARVSPDFSSPAGCKIHSILTFPFNKIEIISNKQAVSLLVTGKQHKNKQPVYFIT